MTWPACPECGESRYKEIITDYHRFGNGWRAFRCRKCHSDFQVPRDADESWEAWCPGCGDRVDRAAVRAGAESKCTNEECPVPRFECWHGRCDEYSPNEAGDGE